MSSDYLLYIAQAGTIDFHRGTPPCLAMGLLVPNLAQRDFKRSVVGLKADAGISPFGFLGLADLLQLQMPSNDDVGPRPSGSDPSGQFLLQYLGLLAATNDVHIAACVAKPHALLAFKRVQICLSLEEKCKEVWSTALHMVIQKSHIFLNDASAFASVVTGADVPIVTSNRFEFITAPDYDRHITYRRYVDTLVLTDRRWSVAMEYAAVAAQVILGCLNRDSSLRPALKILAPLFLGADEGKVLGRGITELPAKRMKLARIEAVCRTIQRFAAERSGQRKEGK